MGVGAGWELGEGGRLAHTDPSAVVAREATRRSSEPPGRALQAAETAFKSQAPTEVVQAHASILWDSQAGQR